MAGRNAQGKQAKGSRLAARQKRAGGSLAAKIVLRVVLPVVLVAAACAGGWFAWRKVSQKRVERLHSTLYSQVQQVAELTVLKNSFSDVVSIKGTGAMGLAKAYSIVKYRGVIRIGIEDVTKVQMELSDDAKRAKVKVPFATFLGNDIVAGSLEVFDEKKSVFVPISTQQIFDEIQVDMEENLSRLRSEGILLEADAQVRSIITAMLNAAGVEQVEVVQVF